MLRVQIFFWILLLLLVPAGTSAPLFRGLFAFESSWEFFWFSVAMFVFAGALMVTANVTLYYANERLFAIDLPEPCPPKRIQLIAVFFICLVPAVFGIWKSAAYSLEQGDATKVQFNTAVTYSLLGFLFAAALIVIAKMLQLFFSDPASEGPFYFLLPLTEPPRGSLKRVLASRPWPVVASRLFRRFREIFARVGQGYLCKPNLSSYPPPVALRGHAFSGGLAAVCAALYIASGFAHRTTLSNSVPPAAPAFPAIVHVLLAMLLALFLLSGLSFFLDRYRVPIIVPLMIVSLLSDLAKSTDHVFHSLPAQTVQLLTPRQLLENRKPKNRLVVVAAAGGGIQAAAWTARVMTGLDEQTHDRFHDRLTSVSSVSGGSAGLLQYLRSYPGMGLPAANRDEIWESAEHDSLEPVAWALVHPDVWRAIFPIIVPSDIDRGWALERNFAKSSGTDSQTLASLANRLRDREDLPALLINTTSVERGAPMVFSTTSFPPGAAGVDSYWDLFRGKDVALSTAVRLSASFPFVSPAARSDSGDLNLHFVDAGYYDNYGIASLLVWLHQAVEDQNFDPSFGVLFLTINSFPSDILSNGNSEPWVYQAIAPLYGLYNVREYSQIKRDEYEQLLQAIDSWFNDHVYTVDYRYSPTDSACKGSPPLSWHLTFREKSCIQTAWDDLAHDSCVTTFLDEAKNHDEIKAACKAR